MRERNLLEIPCGNLAGERKKGGPTKGQVGSGESLIEWDHGMQGKNNRSCAKIQLPIFCAPNNAFTS